MNNQPQSTERCAYCLHTKKRHHFAKMFEHYQTFKFLAKTSSEGQTQILNFNGYCEEPLCDCIQYIPGGSESDYIARREQDITVRDAAILRDRNSGYSLVGNVGQGNTNPTQIRQKRSSKPSRKLPKREGGFNF